MHITLKIALKCHVYIVYIIEGSRRAGENDFSIDFFRLLHVTDSFKFFREVGRFVGIPQEMLVSGAK
jgi:hypothetical protein